MIQPVDNILIKMFTIESLPLYIEYMESGNYNSVGSWTALAGLIVMGLQMLGIVTDTSHILAIGAGGVALAGLVKQWYEHRKLAKVAGVLPR